MCVGSLLGIETVPLKVPADAAVQTTAKTVSCPGLTGDEGWRSTLNPPGTVTAPSVRSPLPVFRMRKE